MNENSRNCENEHDSLKDFVEFQNNMYSPGHYIGSGRVPPTVSAPGNATPLAITYLVASVLFLGLGLILLLSDVQITSSGLIKSPFTNKVIAFIIMLLIAAAFLFFAFAYWKKAKKFHKEKAAMNNESFNENNQDEFWQLICPKCRTTHDIECSACPNCNYIYDK